MSGINDPSSQPSCTRRARNEIRAVLWFLALAFGLSWAIWSRALAADVLFMKGWAILVLALCMWGPGLAAIVVTRYVVGESIRTTTIDRLGHKRYLVWAWLLPAGGTLIAMVLTVVLGAAAFDPEFHKLRESTAASGTTLPVAPSVFAAAMAAFGVTIAPLVNAPFALGEELGWRGFLLPRLMRAGLGQWQALILSGIIWGLWHAPVVAAGYTYPDHPYLGVLLMTVFCALMGIIFGWLQLGSGSVWAPTIAHGALNGIVGLPLLTLTPHDSALGGMLTSLIGWIPLVGFIAWLAWSRRLPIAHDLSP